ncbi:MAG TPA: hypothetical protein VEI03_22740 [Stellaceae bacterium]|nr:hypothetical protein [Stellaceae bacterium]
MRTRRALLAGGAALALGGLGWRAWDRGLWSGGEGPAYAPWSDWAGDAADGVKRPLRAAILAANPHDTQPWLFAVGEDAPVEARVALAPMPAARDALLLWSVEDIVALIERNEAMEDDSLLVG